MITKSYLSDKLAGVDLLINAMMERIQRLESENRKLRADVAALGELTIPVYDDSGKLIHDPWKVRHAGYIGHTEKRVPLSLDEFKKILEEALDCEFRRIEPKAEQGAYARED